MGNNVNFEERTIEPKIGDVVTYDCDKLIVTKVDDVCTGCYFSYQPNKSIDEYYCLEPSCSVICEGCKRQDGENIIYKLIKN